MKSNPDRRTFGLVLLALAALLGGCNNVEMASRWRDREIVIDGKDSDWHNLTLNQTGASDILVGLLNDDRNLYFLLRTYDRDLPGEMAQRGFTVWFDPYGQKKRTLGIHFPIGGREIGPPPERRGEEPPGEKRTEPEDPLEERFELFADSLKRLELIGPDKDERCTLAIAAADSQGVKVKLALSGGLLVYELQVPLKLDSQHPYAIALPGGGADLSPTISIGFETGRFEPTPSGPPGSSPRSGVPGGGMGPPEDMLGELELWANVKIASKK